MTLKEIKSKPWKTFESFHDAEDLCYSGYYYNHFKCQVKEFQADNEYQDKLFFIRCIDKNSHIDDRLDIDLIIDGDLIMTERCKDTRQRSADSAILKIFKRLKKWCEAK